MMQKDMDGLVFYTYLYKTDHLHVVFNVSQLNYVILLAFDHIANITVQQHAIKNQLKCLLTLAKLLAS